MPSVDDTGTSAGDGALAQRSASAPRPIVVITTHRAVLDDDERRSFLQVRAVLGGHDMVVLVPDDLDVAPLRELDDAVEIRRTPNECWGSVANHERMLMSSRFYDWFGDHTHVLVYHLDAFVFRDELLDWCAAGYDYVACPFSMGSSRHRPTRRWWAWATVASRCAGSRPSCASRGRSSSLPRGAPALCERCQCGCALRYARC